MSSAGGPGRFESGLLRKRGAPVLVELLRGAPAYTGSGAPVPTGPVPTGVPSAPEPSLFTGAPPTSRPATTSVPLMRPPTHAPSTESDSPTAEPRFEAKPAAPTLRLAPSTRPAPSHQPLRPMPSRDDAVSRSADSAEGGVGGWYRGLSSTARSVLFAIAGLAIIAPFVWWIAYKRGESASDQRLSAMMPKDGTVPQLTDPLAQPPAGQGAGQSIQQPKPTAVEPKPKPPVQEVIGVDELKPGFNYLVVGNFKRTKDADETVEYLTANGIPAVSISSTEMHGSAGANDRTVIVLKGFAGGPAYKASDKERSDLKSLIQKLGARWKAERPLAPSDLSQPYYDKYRQ